MRRLAGKKSGTQRSMYTVRMADVHDGALAVCLFQRVRAQSPYLLLYPNEGISSAAAQSSQFLAMNSDKNRAVFLAFFQEEPVGFVGLTRGVFRKNAHVASLAMAVDLAHQRRGVGSMLLRKAFAWAKELGVRRLEFTVVVDNEAAIALYMAHRFVVEGKKRSSFLLGDKLVDELMMARLLAR